MFQVFTVLVILLFTQLSPANLKQNECPRSDLSSCFGINRQNGNADWCWANTTADLIGCFQKIGPLNRISALDVASAHFSIDSEKLQETIESIHNSDLSASKSFYTEQIKADRLLLRTRPLLSNFNSVLASIVSYQSRPGYCLEKDLESNIKPTSSTYIKEYLDSLVARPSLFQNQLSLKNDCDPAVTTNDLSSLVYFLNSNLRDKANDDLLQNCQNRKKMRPMLPIYFSLGDKKQDIAQVLIENLSKGVPSAIGYDINLLKGDKYSNIATHAGTVIGSRWSEGRCEFKVRDGNGSDCQIYPPKLRRRCSLGNLWLSEEELNNSVEHIAWISSP